MNQELESTNLRFKINKELKSNDDREDRREIIGDVDR